MVSPAHRSRRADPSIVKEVDAYKYEWSLYGLDELESKKKAWCEVANLLFNECFIKSGTVAAPTAYRTPDDNGWDSLSDAQKKEFTSKSAYIDKLNQYLDYMSFNTRNNSLTKTNCKGIIRQCEDAIVSRRNEITSQCVVINGLDRNSLVLIFIYMGQKMEEILGVIFVYMLMGMNPAQ